MSFQKEEVRGKEGRREERRRSDVLSSQLTVYPLEVSPVQTTKTSHVEKVIYLFLIYNKTVSSKILKVSFNFIFSRIIFSSLFNLSLLQSRHFWCFRDIKKVRGHWIQMLQRLREQAEVTAGGDRRICCRNEAVVIRKPLLITYVQL